MTCDFDFGDTKVYEKGGEEAYLGEAALELVVAVTEVMAIAGVLD